MNSLLIRRTRVVPLGRGAAASAHPVDVLIEDGRVTTVAGHVDPRPGCEEVDADGRWCAPGLWDQHVHLTQWVLASQRLDLAPARTPEQALALVGDRLADRPGEPVVAWGHRAGGWGREVGVAELDAVTGEVPTVLISGDGHHAWLNTAALRGLGLPPRETVVSENDWFALYPRLGNLVGSDDASPGAVRSTLDAAASRGVVGLVDFEFDGPREVWADRWAAGCDVLRVRWATYAGTLEEVVADGLRTGDALPGCDERASMGPLKIISDGSLNTRTAWCCEPYAGPGSAEHPAGRPNFTGGELRDLLGRAQRTGLEVATHAIGDAAVAAALAAYAETGAAGSIEHAQLVTRADVRRMAALGVRASVQPAHLLDDRDPIEALWPGRAERSFAFRWMLDDGVTVVLGSDAPVSPLDPWLAMAAAVHRSADERGAWHPEQALTAAEALAASVDGQSTVGPGSPGDLVLLDADPLAAHADTATAGAALRAMPVALTAVAGRMVHSTL